VFVEASDAAIREQRLEVSGQRQTACDLESDTIFFKGWYAPENDGTKKFRWSSGIAYLNLENRKNKKLGFRLFTNYPLIKDKNVTVTITNTVTKRTIESVTLDSGTMKDIHIHIPEQTMCLEFFVDVSWRPSLLIPGSCDDRVLGIGISNMLIT
jgi:hypothetical protein